MPMYPYCCAKCGMEWEEYHSLKAKPKPCPICNARPKRMVPTRLALITDTRRNAGRHTLLQQCGGDEKEVMRIVKAARANGYEPKTSDVYDPCVALKPGDPQAFRHHSDSNQAFLREVAASRGQLPTQQGPEPKKKPLADRVVRRMAKDWIAKDPSWKHRPKELREAIVQKHARQGDS